MSWLDFYLGVTVALILVLPLIVLTAVVWFRNRRRKGKVWLDLQLPHEAVRPLVKPGEDGWIRTKWGAWKSMEGAATTFRGLFDYARPMYRVKYDDPLPIVYGTSKLTLPDGTVRVETVAERSWVHPKRLQVMLDTDIAAKVYRKSRMEVMLLAIAGLLVIVLLVVVAK